MATAPSLDRPSSGPDLPQADVADQAPRKASRQILRHELGEGLDALERPAAGLYASGLAIGFSKYGLARPEAQTAPAEAR